jgi:HlyD family secretion protein
MKVEANVDEADIGQVKVDQKVTFTVDAFPDDKFKGKVTQIRLNPTVSSNVVTYKVIVEAPNLDLKLMPGLTASISIVTKEVTDVLVVSTKALHFTPDLEVLEKYAPKPPRDQRIPEGSAGYDGAETIKETSTEMASSTQKIANQVNGESMVWVRIDNTIHPKKVKTGLGDGTLIEIQDGLNQGDTIITSSTKTQITSSKTAQAQSPFMPKMPQRNRKN